MPVGAPCLETTTYAGSVPRARLLFVLAAVLLLTACDGYVEEIRVRSTGEAQLSARATVVCTDELQQALFGGDPCPVIDDAARTGEIGDLPFGYQLDANEVSIVASGEADRRVVDATWTGDAEDMASLLVDGGTVTVLDEDRTEVVFRSTGTPAEALANTDDPELSELLRRSRWESAEFRINAPDLVEEHNGDRIQGRIVIWDIDNTAPDEFRLVWTTADPARRIWWVVVATLVLLGVITMMLVIERPGPKPKSTAESDASDQDGTTAVNGSGS